MKANLYSKGRDVKVNSQYFTGKVRLKELSSVTKSKENKIYHVRFTDKSRTKMHCHNGGQTLIVTKGEGSLETFSKVKNNGRKSFSVRKQKKIPLKEWDVIYIPANKLHTHGAIGKGEFSHIAINAYPTKNKEPKTRWYNIDSSRHATLIA